MKDLILELNKIVKTEKKNKRDPYTVQELIMLINSAGPEGMTAREIADLTGMTTQHVSTKVSWVNKRFKTQINKEMRLGNGRKYAVYRIKNLEMETITRCI